MVAKSSPDWLPAGWAVQFRVQKTGRKIEFYTNLETGKNFFSKDDVMRHIKMASTNGGNPQPTTLHNQHHSEKIPSQLVVNTTEYPEWLPKGWKVEVRTRKTGVHVGKEYKCYIDPSTECSFYSKPEVFRYLKTVKRKSCKSRNLKTVNHKRCMIKKKTVAPLQSANKVDVEKHNVEDLPSGWTKEIKVKRVANRLRRDPYYTDPVSGYVFRSKNAVMHYLETGEISRHAFKPKNKCTNELTLINDESHEITPSSATKRQKFKHPVTRQQHYEDKGSSEISGLELPETESSNLQDKRVPTESGVAVALTADVVQEKHLPEDIVEECPRTMEDCPPIRSSQPKPEVADIHEGKRSLLKVEHSATDPGKIILAGNEPVLTPAADTLNENNSLKIVMEKGNVRTTQTGSRKSKSKEKLNLPRRSSKRLAGLEPEQVANSVSSEQALQVVRKCSKSDGSQDAVLASDADQQVGAASEVVVAHHTSTDIKSTSHEEALNKGRMPLDDQMVPKEQQQKLESERMDSEKPEPEFSLLFGSDPCLEFAFKTLTGELPIADTVDNEPILKPAADVLQKENSLESEMEKSCSRNTRVNKSKKNKEIKLPHRSSKRLAGVEPELLPNSMSSERALRNATGRSSKSKAIQAVNSADEASQLPEAGPETKFANYPCTTTIDTSIPEQSSNKSENFLEDQAIPQEKSQKFETEKAAIENPEAQFSFPFMDSWSDPCLDFAFKTLTGAIPIEDDLFQGYFQEKIETSHNHRDSLALPDFGSPSFFQSDILPQFDAPEQSISGQQLPMNSSFLPSGNVGMSNCNGVASSQQLSMNPSFLPSGNVSMSNCNGVASSQQLSMNPSFLPSGNVSMSNCNGVASSHQLSMNPSFLPAGNVSLSNCSGAGSGQQLSMNSPFLPAGNVSLSNCGGVDSQKPCLGDSKDYRGKVKS
ncbi:hypothetical protein PRUPE_5G094800 [Prunus persica]|uniref:MBD domain-containing protein n=2 Tax=Prunus persica TaxID=3760 RepID=A0A251P5Z2_PRUPE|nr:methyl-CpG-binding domain-containing protein 13 [Prunus persica]ONI07006.1 hypothetical protein PRUPE_5G094800 [Prunus persica]